MKNIELVFFDAGGGHRAAATATEMVTQAQQRPWTVRLTNLQEALDPLDILKKYAGIRIQDMYNTMLRSGWTLGAAQLIPILQLVIRVNQGRAIRLLRTYWKQRQPDMVVSFVPHFNRILYESFHQEFPGRPFVTIITDIADYPPHFWIERQPQYLICGSEHAVAQALAMGHSPNRISRTSGMILHPRFYDPPSKDRVAERVRLGLEPDPPTGLVLFGGYGSKAMLRIADRLHRSALAVQLIFICGKNQRLREQLSGMKLRFPCVVEGFTAEVNEYMHLADFFIGKPGPGSISEALAMGLPVIVERNAWTLPQERYNADWIIENGVGLVVPNFNKIDAAVTQLTAPDNFATYQSNVRKLKNRAVFEVPDILEKIFNVSAIESEKMSLPQPQF